MYENISLGEGWEILEEGWEILEEGIAKAMKFLEGRRRMRISSAEYIKYYTCAFCVGKQSYDYCAVIYDRYKSVLEQIVSSMVLPSLMGKMDEFLLQALVITWSNYRKMTTVTSGFLAYLDRFYIPFSSRPPLKTMAASCFFNLVFPKRLGIVTESVRDAVVSLMNREREGEVISHDLINSFMAFIADGIPLLPFLYEFEIETALCDGAFRYYSLKGFGWFMSCTFNYPSKYEECLRMESERAARYMILSMDFRRHYFVQIINNALVEAYQKAFRAKMTNFALRSAYSHPPKMTNFALRSAYSHPPSPPRDARPLPMRNYPTWISMMDYSRHM